MLPPAPAAAWPAGRWPPGPSPGSTPVANQTTIRAISAWRAPHPPPGGRLFLPSGRVQFSPHTASPPTADTVVAGVNLTQLFAPPSAAELQAVRSERAARELPVVEGRILLDRPNADGTRTLVLSHRVAGELHYGAVRLPSLAPGAQAPVILVLHGGKDGAKLDALDKMDRDYADLAATAVIVLPAYRGEAIAGTPLGDLLSEGDFGSPEDHADDALSLLNVVEALVPEVDTARTAVYGTSRGGGVALAVALRADPRVRAIFDLFGAADFFAPEVVTMMAAALTAGRPPGPPGESTVFQQAVQPLAAGQLSVAEARRIILRWSPAQFAAAMSRPLQVHHGTADQSVPVGHSLRLAAAMATLGRGAPDFAFFAYEGGGHGQVPGAAERIRPLLAQALAP
ncbi:MAG: acetylxylan esterase [Ardenticatenia bacterium]|nr:acetylxylan esterase [Ardenticatenia bacterium]